ncbi:MAG: nitrate ABC transporter ATP-binding protein [Pseudomonadota bacterium]
MSILAIEGLCLGYGEGPGRHEVLDDINLELERGELLAIVGFSGSGKTTLISAIAGLVAPDKGTIVFDGETVTGPGPDRAVVFQSYSLMPWLTVRGNVSLAVESVFGNRPKAERNTITDRYVEMVGLSHAVDRRPAELSGGMRQRVAVARALAMQPEMLLLDEPLSALDALTRAKLQDELAAISAHENRTIVLITNDVDEAILLADRVIPLTPGPAATLGPEFHVTLERPRMRNALNDDAAFIRLRAEITQYLIDRNVAQESQAATEPELPNVVPIGREPAPPETYIEAAKSPIQKGYVEFGNVNKVYPTPSGALTVVDGFDMKMTQGEFITLIGHSGCGKSTVLSMVAGLTPISDGGVILDGREVDSAGPDRAVVFQAPSLMPWMTARQNVALGVDRVYPQASRGERNDIVEYYLHRVGLGDALDRSAAELSNGMKQRVGIARAFALSPKLLLLDEPFGMLDSLTRWELQDVLMDVWTRTQVTAICVTHDVDEAILLADRVVMMTNGPNARIGNIMPVDLPRPRSRRALLAHPDYYGYRAELLDFLEAYEGGANPDPQTLERLRKRREDERESEEDTPARIAAGGNS